EPAVNMPAKLEEKRHGIVREFFEQFRYKKPALISFFFLCAILLLMFIGPYIVPYGPQATDYDHLLEGPTFKHLAGTDAFGRDVFSRLIAGARISLGVGVSSVLL